MKLGFQVALLGHVSPNLRAICAQTEDNKIDIHIYYDGEISEDDHESVECILDEVRANFYVDDQGDDVDINFRVLRVDYPTKLELLGDWVYYRRE